MCIGDGDFCTFLCIGDGDFCTFLCKRDRPGSVILRSEATEESEKII